MNFLCRPDAETLLAENDFARLWPFLSSMGDAGAPWLTEAVKDRYRAVWRQGLAGALNYYRASPLRSPANGDSAVMKIRFAPEQVTVHVPTLVVWGEADTALPPNLLDDLERYVPQMKLVRIARATHWIVHEQPVRLSHEIEAVLAAHA